MNYTFADLLKGFRKRADISQSELADAVKRSRNTISNWERAHIVPEDRDVVLALRHILSLNSVELDDLLRAARFATQDRDQDISDNRSSSIDKRREIIYKQPADQSFVIGDANSSLATWFIPGEFTDCSLECQIKIIDDGGPDKWAGMRFRGLHTDIHDIGLGYLVYLRANGSVELFKQRAILSSENNEAVQDPKTAWTKLRCDLIGPRIMVFVNNELHTSVSDSKFGSGYICLHTYFVRAEYKNVEVYSIKP
jgi:transcriptional regulator with XRE-family HTH domain